MHENALPATVGGCAGVAFTVLAVIAVDKDELLEKARTEALVSTGVEVTMHHVMLDDVDASMLGLTAYAEDDVLLLNTCVNAIQVAALKIPEVVDEVNTSVVVALVAEDDILIRKATAHAEVEVLAPPTVLVDAACATGEGSGVITFTVITVRDVAGDELLDSTKTEVLMGTRVEGDMNPLVLRDTDDSTLMMTTATYNNVPLLNTFIYLFIHLTSGSIHDTQSC